MLRRTFLALGLCFLGPAPPKRSAKAVQIAISGVAFAEVKQALAVGDTVEWINKDVVAHTATAKNKDWRVVIPENGKATLLLKKPGTVDYYCEYHPNMTGRLVIREKPVK